MPRPLDTLSLQLFVAVCEAGSIARAAERESLVASALSKRMAALEAELGVPLLQRLRRGVVPTPAGAALLLRAREALSSLEQARAELAAFASGVQGSVRVLASPSVLAEHLPDDIAAFVAQHPRIHVGLDERTGPGVVRGVREGAADLGVLWAAMEMPGLQVHDYRQDRLCVALPSAHALARRPELSFARMLDEPLIGIIPGGQLDQLLRRRAALLGRLPAFRMQVSSLDAAARMVAAGLGLAVLPREAATPHAGAGRLALVPLAEDWAVRRLVLVARAGAVMSPAAALLMERLQRVIVPAAPAPKR